MKKGMIYALLVLSILLIAPVIALVADPYKVDWNMQIDSSGKAACTIVYGAGKYSFNMNEDKTLSKSAGPCLSLSSDKYWLKVAKTKECVEKIYNITCDNDFVVSLLYLEKGIYNVPVDTFSGSYNETVTVDIIESIPPVTPSNDCQEVYKYTCWASCPSGEEEVAYSCQSGVCCRPKGATVSCEEAADCKKIDCNLEYVDDENGIQKRCEYQIELDCKDEFDNDADSKTDYSDTDCSDTCEDKGGEICQSDETCSGDLVKASGTSECCTPAGSCEATPTCAEQSGFKCDKEQDCSQWMDASDGLCCSTKCTSKTNILPFVIIAIILALGAAAFFLYKKGFFKKGLLIKKKIIPPAMPPQFMYRPPVRPLQPEAQPVNVNIKFNPPQTSAARAASRPSELDETLKKLKKLAEK